jgi:hypothetical protein
MIKNYECFKMPKIQVLFKTICNFTPKYNVKKNVIQYKKYKIG